MTKSELTAWVQDLYGRDKRFKSARHLSIAAGLNENTVRKVEVNGGAKPETLRAIAVAAGRPADEPLRILGLISSQGAESAAREEWCRLFDDVPADDVPVFLRAGRALVQGLRGSSRDR